MADVQLTTDLSVQGLISQLQQARAEAAQMRTDFVENLKKIKEGFDQTGGSAAQMGQQIGVALNKIDAQSKVINDLTAELENLKKTGATAFDSSRIEAYQKKVQDLEAELARLRSETSDTAKVAAESANSQIKSSDALKIKLTEARESQRLLKLEVKDFGTAIKANDKAIASVQTELNGLTAASGNYKSRSAELKTELQSLYQKHEILNTGLRNAEKEYATTTTNVKNYSKELISAEKETIKNVASSGKFSGALSTIFSSLRQIAYVIPGLGLAGLIGLLIDPLINGVQRIIAKFSELSSAEKHLMEVRKASSDIQQEFIKGSTNEVTHLEFLQKVITDTTRPYAERNNALKAYNEIADKANKLDVDQINNISLVNQKISQQIGLIKDRALARAAESIVTQRAEAFLLAEEQARTKAIEQQNAEIKAGLTVVANQQNGKPVPDFVKQYELQGDINRRVQNDANVKAAKDALDIASDTAFKLLNIQSFEVKEEKKKHKERVDDFKDRSAEILRLEKELADARTSLIEETRKKEIAAENDRYEATVRTLQALIVRESEAAEKINNKKKITTNDRRELAQIADEITLANQNIEAQEQVHRKKLLDIDNRYYKEAADAFKAAQEQINNVLLTDQQKELNDLDKKYDTIIKAVENARKKLQAIASSPAEAISIQVSAQTQTEALITKKLEESNVIIHNSYQKRLDEEKDLALKSIDIIQNSSISEKSLTELKERLKLEVEKTYAEKRLQNIISQYKLEQTLTQENIDKIADPKNIQSALSKGEDIFQFLGIEIKDEKAKKEILDAINKVRAAGAAIIASDNKKSKDLFDFLGIDGEKTKEYLDAFSTVGAETAKAMQPFIDMLQQQVDKHQKVVEAIDNQISKQQELVDKEKQLAEEGYANNYQLEQKRLADLQKSKDVEVKAEKDAMDKKKALQKAQLVADTIGQSSSLITAAARIYEATAAIPPPFGQILAAAGIGIMLTGFVAAKIAAFRAIDQETIPTGRKGGKFPLQKAMKGAASHEEGGVDLVERKSGRKLANLEGDEDLFVVNKGATKKYEPILEAINKDELSKWTYQDLKKFIMPTNIELDKSRHQHLIQEPVTVHHYYNTHNQVTTVQQSQHLERIAKSNEQIAQTNKQIAETNKQIADLEANAERIIEREDCIIYIQGNRTRIVNKKKQG